MKINVFDITGKKLEDMTLDKGVFDTEVNEPLMAQAVRVYLSNQREASAIAKTRASVDRTRKKLYKQKGTGGARHGDRRSPIFVGGGKALGPNGQQNYTLKLSKKMKTAALRSALTLKAKDGAVIAIKGLEEMKDYKTKTLVACFQTVLGNEYRGRTGLVLDKEKVAYKSADNIKYLKCFEANDLTTYEVLNLKKLFISVKALEQVTKRLS